jgi:phenylacetate-CoA ligase
MPDFPRLLWYLNGAMRRLHWNPERLRRFQEKRLRSVISYAYGSVPFYRQRFKRARISSDDIRNLDDLSKLPVVTKEELRREGPSSLVSSDFELSRLKVEKTSGSSGKPFKIYLNPSEDAWRKAIYMRANISCGQKMRDRWIAITNPRHFSDTTNIQRTLGIYAQKCISVFDNVDKQIELVEKAHPDVLDGYSGSLFLLAREIQNRKIETIKPRLVFGTAESIDNPSCKLIEHVFKAPYYDQFGCSEVDRTAWQCPEKLGYHIDIDSVIMQFADQDGQDVAMGERGEIVYTSLFNYSMPLIRYAVGDVGVPSDELCPCGRILPLMKVVEGRKDSILILPSGELLSPRTFTGALSMFSLYDQIEQFQVVQKETGFFKIYVRRRNNSIDENTFENRLVAHIYQVLHFRPDEVRLSVELVSEIPRSKTGKHHAVISEVKR